MTTNTLFSRNRIIAMVSFIAIIAISLMKSAMELEDAEQAYFSQWLRWGYDDQPPLYTWLQYGVNAILGVQILSFSIVRAIIFAFILVCLFRFSLSYLKSESKSNLVVFSLALVPVFIDFTFRRLSHMSLLCLLIIITYILIQKLIQKKSLINYLLLGIVIGLGVLSKYNYVFVLGALGVTMLIDKEVRQVLLNPRILMVIFPALLIAAPHFNWLLGNQNYLQELQSSVDLKTSMEGKNSIPVLSPIIAMVKNIIIIIAPLFALIFLLKWRKKIDLKFAQQDWLFKMMIAQIIIIFLFFVMMGVNKTEERWFLPLLLPFLPLLMKVIDFKNVKKIEHITFVLFLVIVGIQTIRTPVEKIFNIPSDVHFGFQPISEILNSKYRKDIWVLPNVTYAGNIRLLNTGREIYAMDDFSLPEFKLQGKTTVEVELGKEQLKNQNPQDSILAFGRRKQVIYFLKRSE